MTSRVRSKLITRKQAEQEETATLPNVSCFFTKETWQFRNISSILFTRLKTNSSKFIIRFSIPYSIEIGHAAPEYLTISTQEIAAFTKLNVRTIESVFRILSQAGAIQFVPSVSATAYVASKVDVETYKRAIERTSSHDTKSILESLLRLHGTSDVLGCEADHTQRISAQIRPQRFEREPNAFNSPTIWTFRIQAALRRHKLQNAHRT